MNATTLPAILDAATLAGVAAIVSGLLAALAPVISAVPGFRAADAMRSTLMRVLVYALNVGALLCLAWTQNVVISQQMVPALLLAVGGSTVGSHLFYVKVRSSNSTSTAPAVAPSTTTPAPVIQEASGSAL